MTDLTSGIRKFRWQVREGALQLVTSFGSFWFKGKHPDFVIELFFSFFFHPPHPLETFIVIFEVTTISTKNFHQFKKIFFSFL